MRAVLFTTLLTLAVAAAAASGPAAVVYEETSSLGEAMDQFVARISPRAVAATEHGRVMHCGVIGQAGDRYSIRIATSGTWQSCRIDLTNTVNGFTSTGVTYRTATSDQDSKRGFTDTDYKHPRGYIAYGNVVRYQEGRTKDKPVSTR